MSEFLNSKKIIIYFLLIFFGILTISYQINFEDLWLDEMSSFWIADPNLSFNETIERHNKTDWHNPKFFNLFLKFYLSIFGYEPQIARHLSLIFGSLSLLLFGLISYEIKRDNTFLLTTFLACVSIYIIKYSQEVRPYSLLLVTSAINIYLYLRLIGKNKNKKFNLTLFTFFSVINYSTNPFALIIFFSQIFFSIYKFFIFKEKHFHFYLSILFISSFYLFLNYEYILIQISFDDYMLSTDIKNVLDGFYFPRFFGSKIMGYFYLLLLVFLIIKNRKKIFNTNNNYLFLVVIIVFSYLIPLLYGILKTPVLHDRYLIFILIPILILISCLIGDIESLNLKRILFSFLIILTIVNHYIEIFDRPKTKPEFNKILNDIQNTDDKNVVLYNPRGTSVFIINYLRNIKPDIKKTINFYEYKNLDNNLDSFWILCYMPEVNFNCKVPLKTDLKIFDQKKYKLVEAYLYK